MCMPTWHLYMVTPPNRNMSIFDVSSHIVCMKHKMPFYDLELVIFLFLFHIMGGSRSYMEHDLMEEMEFIKLRSCIIWSIHP